MQLPRVVIAAVFFAIGALIAVPAIWNTVQADGAPAAERQTASPTTPTDGTTSPSDRGSPSPTGGRTSPSPSPSRTSPSPSRTASTPAARTQPLQVSIGSVRCPGRTVQIMIRNTGRSTDDYAIERNDGGAADPGQIPAGQTRTETITLREDRRTTIQVTRDNQPVRTRMVTANCNTASPTPDDTDDGTEEPSPSESPDDELPHTGPEDNLLWARAATGGAAMITGVIIFWYGGIWPRRRERIFGGGGKQG